VLGGKYKADKQYETLGLEKTIFHEILESDIPNEEKSFERLWQEAQVIIGAGADTTVNAFTVTHFHLLDNPDILKKLQANSGKLCRTSMILSSYVLWSNFHIL
jgi:cytochrome P450